MTDEQKPRCIICQGTEEEHEGRQHVFTTQPGQLITREQQAQQQRQNSQGAMPTMLRLGGAATNEANAINRLVEVLRAKNILSLEEAYYVVSGQGPSPAQFADPAVLMGVSANGDGA